MFVFLSAVSFTVQQNNSYVYDLIGATPDKPDHSFFSDCFTALICFRVYVVEGSTRATCTLLEHTPTAN